MGPGPQRGADLSSGGGQAPGTHQPHFRLSGEQAGGSLCVSRQLQHGSGGRLFCPSAPARTAPRQRDRVGQCQFSSLPNAPEAGRSRGLPTAVPARLLTRSQSHRTSLGRLQDPPPQRPPLLRQPLPFYRQYVPMLLLIAIEQKSNQPSLKANFCQESKNLVNRIDKIEKATLWLTGKTYWKKSF